MLTKNTTLAKTTCRFRTHRTKQKRTILNYPQDSATVPCLKLFLSPFVSFSKQAMNTQR